MFDSDECDLCHSDEEVQDCRDQMLCINCRAGIIQLERDRDRVPMRYSA